MAATKPLPAKGGAEGEALLTEAIETIIQGAGKVSGALLGRKTKAIDNKIARRYRIALLYILYIYC